MAFHYQEWLLPCPSGKAMRFHPATQILAWCLLVAAMQVAAHGLLLAAAALVLLCALAVSRHKFLQLLRRTRWIMLPLLLIYAWSTPGHALPESFGVFGPTREGLLDGALQLTRLLAALASLAILLERLHRQQLIAGLYALFAPLRLVGVSRERLAVRLALTLHYAEVAMLRGKGSWRDTLDDLLETHGVTEDRRQKTGDRTMELPLNRFALADVLLLGGAMSILWLVLR